MGKTLILMRHAKSSWSHQVDDHDRPLNERGLRDAPRMADRLQSVGAVPDLVLTSTALRARVTAELVCEAMSEEKEPASRADLYLPRTEDIVEAVACIDVDASCVMVVAHNPGITEAVFSLTRSEERMPTAAAAIIDLDINCWSDLLLDASGSLRCVCRPKDKADT